MFTFLKGQNASLTEKLIKDLNETINRNIKDSMGYRKVQL